RSPKFLWRHHFLDASGEDLVSCPGRSHGAKNEKRGDHQAKNRTGAERLHHIYRLPKFRDANTGRRNVKVTTRRKLFSGGDSEKCVQAIRSLTSITSDNICHIKSLGVASDWACLINIGILVCEIWQT